MNERVFTSNRHRTFYLESGPADGPLLVFIHGWPDLSILWKRQIECFAGLGFRCVAPDMRGYGGSSVPPRREDYALEFAVEDMLELLDQLGAERAVWIGHDWGGPVVWSIASHHPERCHGVASLCVPYLAKGFSLANLNGLVDRKVYPEAEFPHGQWDYQAYYQTHFEEASRTFDANVAGMFTALFRRGRAENRGKPAVTSMITRSGGWFGGAGRAPDLPRDESMVTEEELARYIAAFSANGFSGPDSWYVNQERNLEYASRSKDGGVLSMPALFLHAAHDYVCETIDSPMAEPMRRDCRYLTEGVLYTGHWMPREQPERVNAAIAQWLVTRLPQLWPA